MTWWFVYDWGKPTRQKLHLVIFRSPLPKFHYYHNKRLQVKESQYLIPTYSWTPTLIPNWTCSVVTICPFDARLSSTWLTNCADPNTRFHPHNEDLEDVWSQNPTVHKHSNFFRRDELGRNFCLWLQIAWTNFAQHLCNLCTLWRPLK